MQNQTLTKSELVIMNMLWEMADGATIHSILDRYGETRPAYTTVATFLKILQNKGFVTSEKCKGKTLLFKAAVSKDEYSRRTMEDVKKDLFGGSLKSLLNFFVREEQLTQQDFEELLLMVKHNK